jgi:xanthine/uracil/vitamin C permease (AzgA family)
MLWIARFYAMWVCGFDFVRLISYSNEPDTVTVVVNPAINSGAIPVTGTSAVIVHHGPASSLIVTVLLSAFLIIGLLMIKRKFGRIILGTAAVSLLAITLYELFHLLFLVAKANSMSADFLQTKFPLILVACFWNAVWQFVNIWLTLRPPQNSNTSHPVPGNNYPLPQSC